MNKIAGWLNIKSLLPIGIAAVFLAFVLTVQLPVEIYINNADEFTVGLGAISSIVTIAFSVVFLIFFLPALIPVAIFRERYFSFLAVLALLMWFTSHFMFGHYGAFDGRELSFEPFSVGAVIEAIGWILALILAVIFSKKIHQFLYQVVLGLFCITIVLTAYQVGHYSIYNTKNVNEALKDQPHYMPEEFLTFSTRGNVIHIVLDELQSTVIEHILQTDSSLVENLKGFIFFPDTAANYRSTVMAIPAMLSGEVYKNQGDKNIFLESVLNRNPFMAALENAEYRTHIYSMAFYCNKTTLKNCIPQPEPSADMSAVLLLDYSVFKAAPDMLKPRIYRDERWIIKRHFVDPRYETTLGGLNHLAFKYFNENIQVKDITPTYKFYHSMITHIPMVLNNDCGLRTTRVSRKELSGKAAQATCAFKHIVTFLDKLKQAGIYDNTLIIISSDHGSDYVSSAQRKTLIQSTVEEQHYSRALATLLIKPFNSDGPFRISQTPVALNDIPNTILGSLNLSLLPQGENILTLSEQAQRNREYIFYEMDATYWDTAKLPPLIIYNINGDVRDPRNWQIKCSDASSDKCTKD